MVSFGAELARLNLHELRTVAQALGVEHVERMAHLQVLTAILEIAFGNTAPANAMQNNQNMTESQRMLAWEILRCNNILQAIKDGSIKVASVDYKHIPQSDLYGFVCQNAVVDDFANPYCTLPQKLVDKYELRDGSIVGVTLKKNGTVRDVQSIDLIPVTYFGYHTEWKSVQKIAPHESHITVANEFPVAKGGLTVLTGPERKKLAADIMLQVEDVFDIFAAVPFGEEYLRDNGCWVPTVCNAEAACLMYERAARRAELGRHTILYYDLDGGFSLLPYYGASQVGTLAVIVASKDPIPEANTVLYADQTKRKKGYVVDVDRSTTNVILSKKK